MTAHLTRLERFRMENRIRATIWAAKAGISRAAFKNVRYGSDPHMATVVVIVRAVSSLLGRRVHATEIFDVGEDTPPPSAPLKRKVASEGQQKTLKPSGTPLDRILREERIIPNEFARNVGIVRQSLQRFRSGTDEPCLSTLSKMVSTLRQMTGKPYLASHLYDVGEGLGGLVTT
jgi:predicted transcriptional regulator